MKQKQINTIWFCTNMKCVRTCISFVELQNYCPIDLKDFDFNKFIRADSKKEVLKAARKFGLTK